MTVEKYVFAAFKITEERSVAYIKRKSLDSFIGNLRTVIEAEDPDYISIRIIKKPKTNEGCQEDCDGWGCSYCPEFQERQKKEAAK